MAATNGVTVRGPVVPADTTDVYPTHIAEYGMGGFMVALDNTVRDAIPAERRVDGMVVFVTGTAKFWQLRGGIANGNWVELALVPV